MDDAQPVSEREQSNARASVEGSVPSTPHRPTALRRIGRPVWCSIAIHALVLGVAFDVAMRDHGVRIEEAGDATAADASHRVTADWQDVADWQDSTDEAQAPSLDSVPPERLDLRADEIALDDEADALREASWPLDDGSLTHEPPSQEERFPTQSDAILMPPTSSLRRPRRQAPPPSYPPPTTPAPSTPTPTRPHTPAPTPPSQPSSGARPKPVARPAAKPARPILIARPHVEAHYPREARRLRLEGTAIILLEVGPSGAVLSATVHRASGIAILDRAAIRAARAHVFAARAPGRILVPIRFSLRR